MRTNILFFRQISSKYKLFDQSMAKIVIFNQIFKQKIISKCLIFLSIFFMRSHEILELLSKYSGDHGPKG